MNDAISETWPWVVRGGGGGVGAVSGVAVAAAEVGRRWIAGPGGMIVVTGHNGPYEPAP